MYPSKTVVHGIYILCYLSKQADDDLASATEISRAVSVPREHARKILTELSGAGLLSSVAGRSGGYRLERDLSEISVLDVLDALHTPAADLGFWPRTCSVASEEHCSVRPNLAELHRQLREVLASRSLASLVTRSCQQQLGEQVA